ncbi:unnamed protein product [Candidula unifasciata]|uniref:Integrator complex subunit 2 n=1 Tax=Candidula unifasciata TaxID=100452 RepID=A0A8S3Z0U5_9EUPU|nr:unnamed protein product [Candidula unifasciata]
MSKIEVPVKPHVFKAMQTIDTEALASASDDDLRPVLAGLVRMALCAPLDASVHGKQTRMKILAILSRLEVVNSIVDMLSIDFHALEQDVKKEQQLRAKLGGSMTESVLVSQLPNGLVLEFERSSSDPAQRIRLLLSELLFISSEVKEQKNASYHKQSDLFECSVYTYEILDALCIAMAELPNLLNLLDISEALLCVENGCRLICQLVANNPEMFLEVCNSLTARGDKLDEESLSGRRRLQLLRMLCLMDPKTALTVRNYCVEYCTMPGFAVVASIQQTQMTTADNVDESCSDIIPFFTGLLLGTDVGIRNWISAFVKAGQKRRPDDESCMLNLLRRHLLDQLTLLTPAKGQVMEESKIVAASSLIRLYNALKGIATMKYSEDEMSSLLKLVISRPSPSRAGAHFITLGICTLMASPGLLRSVEEEQQAVNWLRWLMTSEDNFERYSEKTNSPGEMLFLLALNFHNNQMVAITDLICNTLGMKITVKTSALVKIRQIFTMELFTEQVVAAHAVKIPVTPNLDAKSTGYLPVHSILQLLKNRIFSKHKISIKKWVYRQICSSCFPLHPLLPQLIESYVHSVIPKSPKPEHTNEPISEDDILAVFDAKKKNSNPRNRQRESPPGGVSADVPDRQLCPQLLMLYYLLLFEDLYQMHKKMIDVTKLALYNDTVMSQIPISHLVQEALKHHNNCQNLFPPMIRLLNTHFPHLCLVEDWLDAHVGLMSTENQIFKRKSVSFKPEFIHEAFSEAQTHPSRAIKLLEQLLSINDTDILKECQDTVVASIPRLLEEGTPRRLLDLMKKVWFKLHGFTPRKCPPILEIVLRILSAYTQACRVYLSSHVMDAAVTEKEKDRQELKIALLAAQESAVVQILLEVCLPLESEKEQASSELYNLREVRCLVFSYIHQVFIADPNLAKLVHFQGYPSMLIPFVVSGVPSMHICLDFIPELLGQPQRNKQVFGIQLLSHLCQQYQLPKSMNIAKLGIDVMFTLLSVLEKSEWVAFFQQTVPCLLPISQAFPPLCDDAAVLLMQLGRVCYSQITVAGNASKTDKDKSLAPVSMSLCGDYDSLYQTVKLTFSQICGHALVMGKLY